MLCLWSLFVRLKLQPPSAYSLLELRQLVDLVPVPWCVPSRSRWSLNRRRVFNRALVQKKKQLSGSGKNFFLTFDILRDTIQAKLAEPHRLPTVSKANAGWAVGFLILEDVYSSNGEERWHSCLLLKWRSLISPCRSWLKEFRIHLHETTWICCMSKLSDLRFSRKATTWAEYQIQVHFTSTIV